MKILNETEWIKHLREHSKSKKYLAMYSTLFDGVVTDAALMVLPIDDHMVHRGDGVFEAMRVTPSGIYLLRPHLERLFRSAGAIDLKITKTIGELQKICEELVSVSKFNNHGVLRLFVSRGPGDFSPNPYSTIGSQIYIVAVDFVSLSEEKYEKGVSVMLSKVGVKPAPYATVKSCNYLPNVMMKKESLDAGYDFSVSVTTDGFLAEGPTENIMILTAEGELLAPNFDYTLRGTTLVRALELAERLKSTPLIKNIRVGDIHISELERAREIMMVGTTLSVLPVTKYQNTIVGSGKPGAVAQALRKLVDQDMG